MAWRICVDLGDDGEEEQVAVKQEDDRHSRDFLAPDCVYLHW